MAYQYYGYRPYNEPIRRKVTVALGRSFYKNATAEAKQKPGVIPPATYTDVNTIDLELRPHVLPPHVSYASYSNVVQDFYSYMGYRALLEDVQAQEAVNGQ